MVEKNDWRIMGQNKYLKGKIFEKNILREPITIIVNFVGKNLDLAIMIKNQATHLRTVSFGFVKIVLKIFQNYLI